MEVDLYLSTILLLSILSPITFLIISALKRNTSTSNPTHSKIPTPYPILGSIFAIRKNKERRVQWISDILNSTPNLTFTLHRPFGYRQVFTANAANVQHVLKTHFHNYPKGDIFRKTLKDFLGNGIFNADGAEWKLQRRISSHQFNTKTLRIFVESVVDAELSNRLVPILESAAQTKTVFDLQDILQRFAFDNICKIAFGYDPAYLTPSLQDAEFAGVFDYSLKLISQRFNSNIPFVWKIKRALRIGNEKQLKIAVGRIRNFSKEIIREKKKELAQNPSTEPDDLLSRFLSSGESDEDYITDIVISFILAGRDTTSAALTWFFWLISKNPEVEHEILREIRANNNNDDNNSDLSIYEEVKNMEYTHASLCEAMRLYPPVPVSTKSAANDDVLPDGTAVRRGTRISYHPYAMGRVEKVWGADWEEFRPGRWLEWEEAAGKWGFVGRDPFVYPVFQAGPRVCLGKEMAFLQMKRVVAGVLRRFRVVPAAGNEDPVYVVDLTAKMKGGFLVKIQEREGCRVV